MMHAFTPSRRTMMRTGLLALSLGTMAIASAYDVTPRTTPMVGDDVDARVGAMIDNMSTSQKINFTRVNDGHMIPVLPSQARTPPRSARSIRRRRRWPPAGRSTAPSSSAWRLPMKPARPARSRCCRQA
jgi:hypothetical protein